jgi:hypothetical protein
MSFGNLPPVGTGPRPLPPTRPLPAPRALPSTNGLTPSVPSAKSVNTELPVIPVNSVITPPQPTQVEQIVATLISEGQIADDVKVNKPQNTDLTNKLSQLKNILVEFEKVCDEASFTNFAASCQFQNSVVIHSIDLEKAYTAKIHQEQENPEIQELKDFIAKLQGLSSSSLRKNIAANQVAIDKVKAKIDMLQTIVPRIDPSDLSLPSILLEVELSDLEEELNNLNKVGKELSEVYNLFLIEGDDVEANKCKELFDKLKEMSDARKKLSDEYEQNQSNFGKIGNLFLQVTDCLSAFAVDENDLEQKGELHQLYKSTLALSKCKEYLSLDCKEEFDILFDSLISTFPEAAKDETIAPNNQTSRIWGKIGQIKDFSKTVINRAHDHLPVSVQDRVPSTLKGWVGISETSHS